MHFTFENTKHKLGFTIWGDRNSFYELHELLDDCYSCADYVMTRAEESSYIGVIAYFAYSVRHASMGDRLVKLDGKPVKQWDDDMFQLFEDQSERFEVGVDFSWPQMLFIMASWWECLKHKDCPPAVLPIIREFNENIELVLQKKSKVQYPALAPYVHGAIYAANPYLMQTMTHINAKFLERARFGNVTLTYLAEIMSCSAFGTWEYERYMDTLKKSAKRLGCKIEELTENVDDILYDIDL